jgi:hypothetical protein
MAVENRLAIVDEACEAASGDGLPTLGFRQLASRGDDPFMALRALALFSVGD